MVQLKGNLTSKLFDCKEKLTSGSNHIHNNHLQINVSIYGTTTTTLTNHQNTDPTGIFVPNGAPS